MLSKILKIGSRVELTEIVKKDNGNERKSYISQISDISDDNVIVLFMPVKEGRIIPLPENVRYELTVNTTNGLYKCDIVIGRRYKSGNLYLLDVEAVSEFKRHQRREYFRLEISNDFKFKPLELDEMTYYANTKLEAESVKAKPYSNASVLDISGGGIRYLTKNRNVKDTDILIYLTLEYGNKKHEFKIIGHVLGSSILPNRQGIFEERIQFSNIPKEDREEIIRYIFEVERKRRQKERGEY